MTDRSRDQVGQYVKSWQPAQPSKTYFTDFAGGGVLWVGASYKWHIFTSSGSWTAPVANADVIVVAGGGGAGTSGGGGGAGGVRNLIAGTFVVGTAYTVTVGAAGAGHLTTPTAGGNSSIVTSTTTISATGGGRGGTATQAASSGGSGGGGYSTNAGASGNAGAYTPVEGFTGATGRNVSAGANGSGGGAGGAASAGAEGAPYGGGNRDVAGDMGSGISLPDDCSAAPLFDNIRVKSSGSQYTNDVSPLLAIGWGGQGMGYAGCVNAHGSRSIGGVAGRGYSGGIGATYNSPVTAARAFGNGGCSGTGTAGLDALSGTAGIVIVRYAL